MYYVLIEGPTYGDLGFEEREKIREHLRGRLEANAVLFQQYDWVWDEEDRCLLLVGQYRRLEDARWWMEALEKMGFTLRIRTSLPGNEGASH